MIMGAEKSSDLPLASQGTRKASGVISLSLKAWQSRTPVSKGRSKRTFQLKQRKKIHLSFAFVL